MEAYGRDLRAFLALLWRRFKADRCAQTASSLAFTTLLSLVPLLTIALTLFSAFPVFDEYSIRIKSFLLHNLMPDMAGRIITQYMQQFTESAMRLTAFGLIFLGLTAMMLLLTVEHAFNQIWRVRRQRPLFKRLVMYWAVLTLAPLLIGVSLALSSWLLSQSMQYASAIPGSRIALLKLLPLLLTTTAFALMFRLVPNRHVSHSHAWLGGIVAALAVALMNALFSFYISHFSNYKLVYGAFASIPIFLLWLYLLWLSILIGAQIAATLPHWHGGESAARSPARDLFDALRILRRLAAGLQAGQRHSLQELSHALHLDADTLEDMLAQMEDAGLVCRAEDGGWLLQREIAHIDGGALLEQFVTGWAAGQAVGDDADLADWLEQCLAAAKGRAGEGLPTLLHAGQACAPERVAV